MTPYDVIVLTGGGSTRLGTDKTRVVIGGQTVFERVLAAVTAAEQRFVVGPEVTDAVGASGVTRWLREDPPGSGPANGVASAVPHLSADLTVILAGDQPFVTAGTVERLLIAAGSRGVSGAVLRDGDGRPQWLTVAVRTATLRERIRSAADWSGASMQSLLGPLDLVGVEAHGDEAHDIDTPDDIPSDP